MRSVGLSIENTLDQRSERKMPESVVEFGVGLKAPDDGKLLLRTFQELTDPEHSSYGKYYSRDQTNALLRPAAPDLTFLYQYFQQFTPYHNQSQSNVEYDPDMNMLIIQMMQSKIEHVFRTKLVQRKLTIQATTPVTIPASLQRHISFTTLQASAKLQSLRVSSDKKYPNVQLMTPAKLRQLYGIPPELTVTNASSTQSIPEYYEQSYSLKDLEHFLEAMNLSRSYLSTVRFKGDRPNVPDHPTGEATLDLQYITAMAPNATTTIWNEKGRNPYSSIDEPFLHWAKDVLKDQTPPLVHSISYADDEKHIFEANAEYPHHFDQLLQKMAIRGLTVVAASGDDGVSGLQPSQFHLTPAQACNKSYPQWPTSSPYVLSVGATQFFDTHAADDEGIEGFFNNHLEVVCSGNIGGTITSGGGFSYKFDTPWYQKDPVSKYTASPNAPKTGTTEFYNKHGRGYPDISAYGSHYVTFLNSKKHVVSGTSASTPVIAAMITLWNDRRLSANKPPLGFINPLLYKIAASYPQAFNDIVNGNNAAAKHGLFSCPHSFHAGVGWDAVSGLGTPKFSILANLTFNAENLHYAVEPPNIATEITEWTLGLAVGWLLLIGLLMCRLIGILLKQRRKSRWEKYNSIRQNDSISPGAVDDGQIEMPTSVTV